MAEKIIDEWIDHDEGVRVIQTASGHRYEPLEPAYRVIRETNNWNRWGAKVNVRKRTVLKTDNLEEAWRYRFTHDDVHQHAADKAVRYVLVDRGGFAVPLVDLYAQVIGEEEFERQCHRPGFSINLDTWLRERIEKKMPLHE
jgi:hypothetical protein